MKLQNLIYLIIALIIIIGGYLIWRQAKYGETDKLNGINCPETYDRYGVLAESLVEEINNEPKSASVLRGYKQILAEIIPKDKKLFLYMRINERGKVSSFICRDKNIQVRMDKSEDFSLTIPEDDFKNIVQHFNSLDENGVATYLKNITTDPISVKKTFIERILN